MKQKIKAVIESFMLTLLQTIKDVADVMPSPFESKGEYQRRVWKKMRDRSLPQIQLGLYRLKQRGLIKPDPAVKFRYNLTLDGRQKLLMSKVINTKKLTNDNQATIIIFDIPEKKAKHRGFLRRLLLKSGFFNLQKSVMISRFELPKEFFELLNELEIRKYVTLIKGQVKHP